MTIRRELLIKDVIDRSGLTPKSANTAIEATLEALGERLSAQEAAILAEALPPALSAALLRLGRHTAPRVSALYARVSVCEGVRLGVAVEHAQVVCRALTEALGIEERRLLQRRLPPEWAALFADDNRSTASDVLARGPVPGHGHTLADGKPGGG